MSIRRALSPGKLILSGEHAVVHGAPALAMAVTAHATCGAEALDTGEWILTLPDGTSATLSLEEAAKRAEAVEDRHRRFLRGRLSVGEIAPDPADLLLAAAARTRPERGAKLIFDSTIPLGSGMGSSAAFLLALFKALRPEWTDDQLYEHALACEQYPHGTSSGLDVAISLRGGLIRMQSGSHTRLDLPAPPAFRLFHTGRPASTTGECVTAVTDRFPDGHAIWRDFQTVTDQTQSALERNDIPAWKEALRENHRLLHNIGVVPDAVAEVVADWEQQGAAAKLCGAGAVSGEAGGILLALDPPDIAPPAHWTEIHASPDTRGTRLR